MEEKTLVKDKLIYYICCFFILCLIGWGIETIEEFIRLGVFTNRGFLYGPYLPIYAFGSLLIYFSFSKLMEKKIRVWEINFMPVILFVLIMVVTAVFEYFVSWLLETIFDRTWWDYSYERFNLNGRIFLQNIIVFGVLGLAYLYWIEPLIRKGILKIKSAYLKYIAIVIFIILVIDIIASAIRHLQ